MSDSNAADDPNPPEESFGITPEEFPDAVVVADPETERIVEVNDRAESLFGYTRSELLGRHHLACHPSSKAKQYRERFQTVPEEGPFDTLPDGTPVYIETASGGKIPVEINTEYVERRGERRLVAVFREVSERREAERRLRSVKTRFKTIFEHSNDAIVIMDPDGKSIHEANQRTCEMLGYTREELLSISPERIHPDELETLRAFLDAVRENHEGRSDSLTCRRKDGETVETEISASLIELEDEPYVLAMMRDVTERVRREQTLRQQRQKLELLNQVVRHDIRNYMQIVLSRLPLLEEQLHAHGSEQYEEIVQAARSTVGLTETARDLTETMLSESAGLEPICLDEVVRDELESLRKRYEKADIRLDEPLPTATVNADGMLDSVVRNLTTNAVVHNDTDTPTVEISIEKRERSVQVHVADNGPGIPDSEKETIFGKGEKGLESPGTGLGLYLVRTLVEQYGGTLRVDDNQPRGSVFTVELESVQSDRGSRNDER